MRSRLASRTIGQSARVLALSVLALSVLALSVLALSVLALSVLALSVLALSVGPEGTNPYFHLDPGGCLVDDPSMHPSTHLRLSGYGSIGSIACAMRILFLGVVLYGILASLGPPRARACSPLALSDWKGYRANVLDGETDVPVDLKLRLVLERIGDITSVFDPEAFVMTCDGTTVAGTWQASVSAEHWTEAALWAVPEIRQRDGVWSSSVGCAAAACVVNGKVYLRALFEPAASLPPGALCEVWLQEPCAEPGCSIPPLPNTYPMQVLTFTTGMADTPDALDLGEPQARALLYPQDIQECGYLEPQNPGSCPTCVTQETVTRLGVVFTFPSTLPEERELFALVYRADSSEGLSASSATTLWLSALDSLSQAGFAVDLRAKGDPPRCVQIAIEDRRGRRSPRSAPFCVDPGDMPWPSSGCGCGAGVEGMTGLGAGGGLGLGMALMVILLLFFRRRR